MGRKPNSVFSEFFHRGEKVKDHSNRYEYTCKACGAHFAKGRQEYLASHLVRLCTEISDSARVQAVEMMNGNSHRPDSASSRKSNAPAQTTRPAISTPQSHHVSDLSALETLAEVSRQRLGSRDSNSFVQLGPSKRRRLDNLITQPGDDLSKDAETSIEEHLLNGLKANIAGQLKPYEGDSQTDISASAQDVAAAASAASSMLTSVPTAVEASQPNLDPSLDDALAAAEHGKDVSKDGEGPYYASVRTVPANPQEPQAGYLTDFRLVSSDTGTPRSRYSEGRREEVRNIRKMGACIRCRILKKPCSQGDPCDTCRKVDTARTWKMGCVRTRLADELLVLDSGFHQAFFHDRFQEAIGNMTVHKHILEVTETDQSNDGFSTLTHPIPMARYEKADSTALGFSVIDPPHLLQLFDVDLAGSSKNVFELCIRIHRPLLINSEPDDWLRAGLQAAVSMTTFKRDDVFEAALTLWTVIVTLTSRDETSRPKPSSVLLFSVDLSAESKEFIDLQIKSIYEQHVPRITRKLAGELERYLQQRNHSVQQRFRTSLASIIILDCLQRFSVFFEGLARALAPESEYSQDSFKLLRLPQDLVNAEVVCKCDKAAAIITSLLRVRSIPPATSKASNETDELTAGISGETAKDILDKTLEITCLDPEWTQHSDSVQQFLGAWANATVFSAASDGNTVRQTTDDNGQRTPTYVARLFFPET